MAWIEKRKTYRLRDRINGQKVTVAKNLGIWKGAAQNALDDYKRACGMGFHPNIGSDRVMADLRSFLAARAERRESMSTGVPVPIPELCAYYIKHHGPSLKGGFSEKSQTNYGKFKNRVEAISKAWADKMSDAVTSLDVRDFLTRFNTAGTKIKHLNTISHLFKATEEWNAEGVLRPPVRVPARNPATLWRDKMPVSEKREVPDTRVLSETEWQKFRVHLPARTRAICELALRRFLRLADIRKFSRRSIKNLMIEGLQEKTGMPFSVPMLDKHPVKYDFTNFRHEFNDAKVAAGMDDPPGHPLHFSPRTLRRTGATWAYRKTKDLVGISKMLGHAKITTTIRYLNIDDADKHGIALALDAIAAGPKIGGTGGADFRKAGKVCSL